MLEYQGVPIEAVKQSEVSSTMSLLKLLVFSGAKRVSEDLSRSIKSSSLVPAANQSAEAADTIVPDTLRGHNALLQQQ